MRKFTYFILLMYGCIIQAPEKAVSYDEVAFNWSRTFAEVAQMAGQKHFKLPEKVDDCWAEAINAFMMCMDPHSSFLPPKSYKQILESTSGSFGGVGIIIDNTRQPRDKFLMIIDIIPGGPCDNEGIKPLDKVVEIDGKLLEGMTTDEATALLKGKPSTTVEIKVLRDQHPELITVTVTRDIIKEQNSLSFYLPDQQIYYVSLNLFTQNAIRQIERLLKKSHEHPYKGLILDLRNNSGGLLTAAIDIVGLFLPNKSLVVQTKGTDNKNIQDYKTTREPIVNYELPIFILINNYTASAGEILAGCLRLHSQKMAQTDQEEQLMVFLVGTLTFGKGSVQEIIPVSNNSAVKITTALYHLPGDISIQGVGIEPDFVVERMLPKTEQMKWFTKSHGRENAMLNYIQTDQSKKHKKHQKAVEKKKKKDSKHKKWAERMRESLQQDNQFKATIMLINLLHMAQTCFPEKVNNHEKAIHFLKQIFVDDNELFMEEVKAKR